MTVWAKNPKEELRAEIASLMIGDQLRIGHDPGQHAAYVESWIKVLKDDPKEILRASRDADKIAGYVMDRNDRRWAVVLMINHKGVAWQAKPVQDALLRWVYKEAGGAAPRG